MVSPTVRQTWAVMGVLLNMLGQGMVLSFPSILLPALSAPDSEIKADLSVASWVASSIAPASLPGFLISSFWMDKYGRKKAHVLTVIPAIIGWILIFFAKNIYTLILGRILNGFSGGCTVILGAVIIGSCVAPAGVPGFLLSPFLMGRYGRKKAHIFAIVPGIIGWVLVFFSTNIYTLILGRIFNGFSGASAVILGAVVIGEYSSPANRGIFLNLKTAAVCLGNMVVHIMGNYLKWNQIALLGLTPQLVGLLIILTWPESPAWLASKRKFEASEKSFNWLRGTNPDSRKELEELIRAQKDTNYEIKTSMSEKCMDVINKFTKRDFLRPTAVILFTAIVLEACGRHFFAAYALQIIAEVTGNKTQSFYYTLAIDLIITGSAVFSSVLVKLMKRRSLLFLSGFSSLFILVCVCVYLFLSSNDYISRERHWIPITLFVVYFILSNLGCTPIPLALLGEVYPLAHRGVGAAVSGLILAVCLMVAMQATPYLLVSVKVHGTFAVYGVALGLSLVVLYYILPETKDRTLQEIEDFFNFGRFRDNRIKDDEEVKMKMILEA